MIYYAVTDIETTGLVRKKDHLLEVGCKIINVEGEVIDVFHQLVLPLPRRELEILLDSNPTVRLMHERSGLLAALRDAYESDYPMMFGRHAVEDAFERFLLRASDRLGGQLHMMGNSVKFDWAFLEDNMPNALKPLQYRVADISSTRVQMAGITGEDWAYPKKKGHRALVDIDETIAEWKWLWVKFTNWARQPLTRLSGVDARLTRWEKEVRDAL